jgi:hypothetical protein
VHPGDTTKGYAGLHWIPAAEAILAGEEDLRSTLFFVDKTIDDGPILVQSAPINIRDTLTVLESIKEPGLHEKLRRILDFAASNDIKKYDDLKTRDASLFKELELLCTYLQDSVKTAGDWKIYPFAVHDLISAGRVEVEEKNIYVDGRLLPIYGYRMETNRC